MKTILSVALSLAGVVYCSAGHAQDLPALGNDALAPLPDGLRPLPHHAPREEAAAPFFKQQLEGDHFARRALLFAGAIALQSRLSSPSSPVGFSYSGPTFRNDPTEPWKRWGMDPQPLFSSR